MGISLSPVKEQVIVITGASSGIGLATATMAAERGAKLVLAARSGEALEQIAQGIHDADGEAIAVVCDVADRAQVQRVADAAMKQFGHIDTWVNDAGVAIYGRLDEVSDEDNRRLFETNFWGVVYGSLIALPYLKRHEERNGYGGALINVGSEVSEAYIPMLGMYTASKHAVKGFTDSLRLEVEEIDQASVAITLIQPTATDTPFPQHARNYMNQEAKLPTPMIDPEKVAEAILDAAEKPTREKRVGTMAKLNTATARFAPGLADKMAAQQHNRMQYDEAPREPEGALHQPSERMRQRLVGVTHGPGGREER